MLTIPKLYVNISTLPSFREEFINRVVFEMVIHKKHGMGQVVGRRFREIGAYITVEFEDGKVMDMVIPDSFEIDCVDAQGALKEEVDKALAIKRELKENNLNRLIFLNMQKSSQNLCRHLLKISKTIYQTMFGIHKKTLMLMILISMH